MFLQIILQTVESIYMPFCSDDLTGDCSKLTAIDDEYGGLMSVGKDGENYEKGLNCTVMVRGKPLPTAALYTDFAINIGFKFKRFDVPDKWPWSGICEDYVSNLSSTQLSGTAISVET